MSLKDKTERFGIMGEEKKITEEENFSELFDHNIDKDLAQNTYNLCYEYAFGKGRCVNGDLNKLVRSTALGLSEFFTLIYSSSESKTKTSEEKKMIKKVLSESVAVIGFSFCRLAEEVDASTFQEVKEEIDKRK